MLRLKAIILVAIFTALLTGSAIYLANDAAVMTSGTIETEHDHLRGIVSDRLADAESGLLRQADRVASDAELVSELEAVREKLLTTTPDDLRRTAGSTWNSGVFNRLIFISEKMSSDIRQHGSGLGNLLRAPRGDMHTQRTDEVWWGDAPGLLLAFASVPMKDGSVWATLIAQGLRGKELQGGKHYEKEIPVLAEVAQNGEARVAHFAWNGKMHVAAVVPVVRDGKTLGTVVIGHELSRNMANRLAEGLPRSIELMVAYAAPGFGRDVRVHAEFAATHEREEELENAAFRASSDAQGQGVPYRAVEPSSVYTAALADGRDIAISRVRWFWTEAEETDVYVISDTRAARGVLQRFQSHMLLAAIVLFALACVICILFMRYMDRDRRRIRLAFAESMASGEPVDPEALALLLGERPESLAPYVLRRANDDDGDGGWDSLMDDATDDAQNGADASENGADANPSETAALYEEYMRLRRENHIDAPMSYEEFLRKLETSTNRIIEKYHCEKVSFLVHVSNGNVVLKPKIVRK